MPNLVSTVKAAGQFEQDTLTKVVEARSKVAGLKVDASTIDDPEKLKKFEAAQNELSGSLSRLLVVSEQYPTLKATDSFRDLQSQLEEYGKPHHRRSQALHRGSGAVQLGRAKIP